MKKTVFSFDFPEGVVKFPFEIGDDQPFLWKIVGNLIPLVDMLNEMGMEIAASVNRSVTCGAGCGVCCCQMVPLSPPEAAIIADVVEHLPKDQKKSVIASFEAAVKKLSKAQLREALFEVYRKPTDKSTVLEINRKYFELGIQCPFLLDGSCSIYERRPSRCREYSVMSPPEYCADPFDPRIKKLPLTLKMCESFTAAWSAFTGETPQIVPLVLALDWIGDNPAITELRVPADMVEEMAEKILANACSKSNRVAAERMGR